MTREETLKEIRETKDGTAQYEVQRFQKELKDINIDGNFGVNISEFLVIADFFFDVLIYVVLPILAIVGLVTLLTSKI